MWRNCNHRRNSFPFIFYLFTRKALLFFMPRYCALYVDKTGNNFVIFRHGFGRSFFQFCYFYVIYLSIIGFVISVVILERNWCNASTLSVHCSFGFFLEKINIFQCDSWSFLHKLEFKSSPHKTKLYFSTII